MRALFYLTVAVVFVGCGKQRGNLEKVKELDSSMTKTVNEIENGNERILDSIRMKVAQRKDQGYQTIIHIDAQSLRKETNALCSYLEFLRNDFVRNNGGWKDDNEAVPVDRKSTEVTNEYFIDKGNGKAYELKKRLDSYIDMSNNILSKYDCDMVDYLAHDGWRHPFFKDDIENSKKDFAELNFQDSPIVAALATLSQIEASVQRTEVQIYKRLLKSVE